MTFTPKGREFKIIGILLLMIAVMTPSAFGKVVVGLYGGGRLSEPIQRPPEYNWQTDVTWTAGSHLGFFVQFYSQADHWGISLETLILNYEEMYGVYHTPTNPTMETFSKKYHYYGIAFEYSLIWKTTQRLIPFIGLGVMTDPLLGPLWGDSHIDFPLKTALKADLGLKYKIFDFVDLKAHIFYVFGNKLLAGSLGIDFIP